MELTLGRRGKHMGDTRRADGSIEEDAHDAGWPADQRAIYRVRPDDKGMGACHRHRSAWYDPVPHEQNASSEESDEQASYVSSHVSFISF